MGKAAREPSAALTTAPRTGWGFESQSFGTLSAGSRSAQRAPTGFPTRRGVAPVGGRRRASSSQFVFVPDCAGGHNSRSQSAMNPDRRCSGQRRRMPPPSAALRCGRVQLRHSRHTTMSKVSRVEVISTGARQRWTLQERRRIVAESYGLRTEISTPARRHGLSATSAGSRIGWWTGDGRFEMPLLMSGFTALRSRHTNSDHVPTALRDWSVKSIRLDFQPSILLVLSFQHQNLGQELKKAARVILC
jgi:hypothetical protein